jgi:hypothetical protein
MADIKDFFSSSNGNQNVTSLAYLLLMANVLGLAVFLDGKKSELLTLPQRPEQKIQQSKQFTDSSPVVFDNKKIDPAVEGKTAQIKKTKIQEKSEREDTVFEQVEQTTEQEDKEIAQLKDNIIDFKGAVALRTQETKQSLKPLIWNFPKK